MATYEYRCDRDGVFELTLPLGTAPQGAPCPICARESGRIISMPMVRCGTRNAWTAAIERADRSRFEPEVVSSVPSAGARRRVRTVPLTPTLARLPRP
jgi:hypothetical protein